MELRLGSAIVYRLSVLRLLSQFGSRQLRSEQSFRFAVVFDMVAALVVLRALSCRWMTGFDLAGLGVAAFCDILRADFARVLVTAEVGAETAFTPVAGVDE